MKIRKLLLLTILSGMFMTACDFLPNFIKKPGSSDTNDTQDPDGGNTDIDDEEEEEEFEHLRTEPYHNGSTSGTLVEIMAGRYLEIGKTYACTLITSSNIDKTLTLVSSFEDVASIQSTSSNGGFQITTHKQGDTIIKAYDVDGTLVLRQLVQVRKSIPIEKMPKHLFEIDRWVSTKILGDYSLTFVGQDPLAGSLSGHDDFEQTSIAFNLVNPVEEALFEFTFYKYEFELDMDNYYSQRGYVSLYVSVTGDQILIYYTSGSEPSLLEMFSPVTE